MTVLQASSDTDTMEVSEKTSEGCFGAGRTVLFVCTGNTCRSPMAEYVFNFDYADSGYEAVSAGLAADGSPVSAHALDALFEEGYRVKGTPASVQLTDELMDSSHIIIGITASHAMQIITSYPHHAWKVYSMPFDIADPFGGSIEVYRACLADIRKALGIVMESI